MMWRRPYCLGDQRVVRRFAWLPEDLGQWTVWLGWYYVSEELAHGMDGFFWSFRGYVSREDWLKSLEK